MRGKIILFVMFLAAFMFTAEAARYARYNQVGYFPDAGKKLVIMSDEDCAGEKWSIKDRSGKEVLSGKVAASKTGKDKSTPMAFNHIVDFSSISTEGTFSFEMKDIEDVKINIGKDFYKKVIQSNLRWIRVVRSGDKEPLDRKPAHFGDTASLVFRLKGATSTSGWAEESSGKKIDLLGGWFDGFTYAKNSLIVANTVYSLLRAYEVNPSIFEKKLSKSDLVDVLDEAKWGLDYLLKLMPDDKEFIISCGGFEDNESGTRLPEEDQLDGKRRCYSAYSYTQMGSVAASLALGSRIFKEAGNAKLASKYLDMAEKIFAATKKAKAAIWMEKDYESFKDASSWDNMLLAAGELYKATGKDEYLTKAKNYAGKIKLTAWPLYGYQVLSGNLTIMDKNPSSKTKYLDELKAFKEHSDESWNFWNVPFGYEFGTTYGSMEVATYALLYATNGGDDSFKDMAIDVLDFMFGMNPWGKSFIALEGIKSVRHFYTPIYILQTHLFPEGGIPVGPLDVSSHSSESKWLAFDPRTIDDYKFNTNEVVYLDHFDDYMCSEVHTYGVADAVFFLSVMSSVMGK